MAYQTLNTLKYWFITKAKPLQQQFWDWMDSFWHKGEKIPSASIDGLQTLLDAKMDKKAVVTSDQVGEYDPEKDYVYDALVAEYVSFLNADSSKAQFSSEGFYRLKEDAPAGEDPETNPEHWAYQGTTIGEITINDVVSLNEELSKRLIFKGAWQPGTYSFNDLVTANGKYQRLCVNEAGTSESAEINPVGDVLSLVDADVAFDDTTTVEADHVWVGYSIIADRDLDTLSYSVNTVAGNTYELYLVVDGEKTFVASVVGDGTLKSSAYNRILSSGTSFKVLLKIFQTVKTGTATTIPYVVVKPVKLAEAAAGQILQPRQDLSTLVVSYTDADATDRTDAIQAYEVDDVITLLDGTQLTIEAIDTATYDTCAVFTVANGVSISASAGETADFIFLATNVSTITVKRQASYFAENANVSGLYGADTTLDAVAETDYAYNFSIDYRLVESSADWETFAVLSTGGVGGGGGEVDSAALDAKADKVSEATVGNLPALDEEGNITDSGIAADTVLNAGNIDVSDIVVGAKKILTVEKQEDETAAVGEAIGLVDALAPSAIDAALQNPSGWTDESKTLTGENYSGELGVTSQRRFGSDGTLFECTSYTQGTEGGADGSATYKRTRSLDILDPDNNTYDSAVCDILDASRASGTIDTGWDATTNILATTNSYCRVGTWWKVAGSYAYFCYAVSSGTFYWYRTGTPTAIYRKITAAVYPALVANLLAHDFTTGYYDQSTDSSNETTYCEQYYWDSANGNLYWQLDTGYWAQFAASANLVEHTASVTLTNAQIKALLATPITLVAAQGEDTIVVVTAATFILYAGTEVLTEAGDNIAIGYADGTTELLSLETTSFIDNSVNALAEVKANDQALLVSEGNNIAVVIYNNGAAEFAGNDTADATMKVIVKYKIIGL